MNEHPDLLALLRGELSNPLAAEAGDHLDGCADCRAELAELATANAMLSRSARTLTARTPAPRSPAPEYVPALPPRTPFRARRRRALGLVAAAAAVVGIAGVATVVTRGSEQPAGRQPQVSAPLDPVEGAAAGRVLMTTGPAGSTEMTITTRDLPRAHRGQFYEAWLFDPTTRKMLPLGLLSPDGRASFEIDDRLLGRYSAVDVSLEADDGDPQHSVTSVLRASYDAQRPTTS